MAPTRRLVLMRHAKAEQHASSDHARPLSERGRRDARAAGALLGSRGEMPALAVVSTAQRTRDTWDAVLEGLRATAEAAPSPEVWFDRALYDGGPREVVEVLAGVEADVASVMVVGHNPTMSVVASALSDGEGDPGLEEVVGGGLPTAALACYDVAVAWPDVNARTLRLTHVDVPRG